MNNLRDKDLLISFGNRLKKLRKERKMTLQSLAFEADVEISQIYRIEKGLINPTLTTLKAIATGLNLPLNNLIDLE